MNDQYYSKEDQPTDTPETALANYQAQSKAVANFVPEAAQDMNRAEQALGYLYQQAEGNPELQEQVTQSWDIVQRTTQKLTQMDQARQLAMTALEKINDQRKKIGEELDQLNEALDDVENMGFSSHPRIAAIVDVLEENLEEREYEGGLYLDCPGCAAIDQGYWYDTELQHDAVNLLCYALFTPDGEDVPGPLKTEIAAAINNFAKQWNEHLKAQRELANVILAQAEAELLDEDEDGDDE